MMDAVGDYVSRLFAADDAGLLGLRDAADRAGMPDAAIAPHTGRLLQLLCRLVGARRVLEVGTLAGYSAAWLARALPADDDDDDGGTLLTVESDPERAEFARAQLALLGLAPPRVTVRTGRGVDVLPSLDGERFDLAFLDADSRALGVHFEWAVRLVRPGGLVVVSNALRGGRVADTGADDAVTRAVREFNLRLAADARVEALVIPTPDGLAIARVRQAAP